MKEDVKIIDIILPLEESENEFLWKKRAAKKLGLSLSAIYEVRVIKYSIDARKNEIKIQIRIEVGINQKLPPLIKPEINFQKLAHNAPKIIIVGSGPAGIFAAIRCIGLGLRPVIFERGRDAMNRRHDLGPLIKGKVIEDSNYCFGEGGAGTYSDGKLYTRATKRGPVRDVYEVLVAHGAPDKILTDAHPHIGSNLLPKVVISMRQSIIQAGGEIHFTSKVTDLLLDHSRAKVTGIMVNGNEEHLADRVILATGHSARDIYKLLNDKNILLEKKPFAVGVRIEHPQPLIDSIQYSLDSATRRPRMLPAARYRLATKIDGRGVHSFCMCPGGYIVPAATENDEVVVNGMSLASRGGKFANSGMVVTVEPEDTEAFAAEHGVLAGIAYQKALEVSASKAGGGAQKAPAQRVKDFISRNESANLPKSSYVPGLTSSRIDLLLPEALTYRMRLGLKKFGRQMKGYLSEEANLIGFETRTSSPIRIPRDEKSLYHPQISGLIPCGEGAGYAGGIVSAALDGMRCAEAAASSG